jgi:hypothetical protein
MPRRVKYICEITNIYTGECVEYEIEKGELSDVVTAINEHMGCEFTTYCGLANFIQRGVENSPKRMHGIKITRQF